MDFFTKFWASSLSSHFFFFFFWENCTVKFQPVFIFFLIDSLKKQQQWKQFYHKKKKVKKEFNLPRIHPQSLTCRYPKTFSFAFILGIEKVNEKNSKLNKNLKTHWGITAFSPTFLFFQCKSVHYVTGQKTSSHRIFLFITIACGVRFNRHVAGTTYIPT